MLNLLQAYTVYSARFSHVMSKQYVKRVTDNWEETNVIDGKLIDQLSASIQDAFIVLVLGEN